MDDLIDKIQKRIYLADKNHVLDTEISVKVLRQVIEALKPVEELEAALFNAAEEAWQSEVIETLMEEHIEESKSDWIESKLSSWKSPQEDD